MKNLNLNPTSTLLPPINLALTEPTLPPQPLKWLAIWVRHIASYSTAPIADLTDVLNQLQNPSFCFQATSQNTLTPLTPAGFYIPSCLAHNTIKTGPNIQIPKNLEQSYSPLLLLQASEHAYHWVALREQNTAENSSLPYTLTLDLKNPTLPFPQGLVKYLPLAKTYLEFPHPPSELVQCLGYQPQEITLNPHYLTKALETFTLLQTLAPTEIEQLKTRPLRLQLKSHYEHKRLKYELTLDTNDIVHSLKGSVPWAELDEDTIPSLITELIGRRIQLELLQRTCTNAGIPVQEQNYTATVQTPQFTIHWRWTTRGFISIVNGDTLLMELCADPSNKSQTVVAPVNETPEAALQRITSLLLQLQTFLVNYQLSLLTC